MFVHEIGNKGLNNLCTIFTWSGFIL